MATWQISLLAFALASTAITLYIWLQARTVFGAARRGDLEAVKRAMADGHDVNKADRGRGTALFYAAWRGRLQLVTYLLTAGADANSANRTGATPLMKAAIGEHYEVVAALLEGGADVNAKNRAGWTPLRYAAGGFKISPQTMELLVDRGADVNAVDSDGNTPLMSLLYENSDAETEQRLGIRERRVEAVRMLLARGADLHKRNKRGRRPADFIH